MSRGVTVEEIDPAEEVEHDIVVADVRIRSAHPEAEAPRRRWTPVGEAGVIERLHTAYAVEIAPDRLGRRRWRWEGRVFVDASAELLSTDADTHWWGRAYWKYE